MKRNKRVFTRKKGALLLSGLLCLTIGSTVAYAAYKNHEQKVNDFTVGDVAVGIEETFTKPSTVKPGDKVTKKVAIKNDSNQPVFVRVMVLPEIMGTQKNGNHLLLPAEIGINVLLLNASGATISDTNQWMQGKDGYYYYLHGLAPGKTTEALFHQVQLAQPIAAMYEGATMEIDVKVEAINTTKWSYQDAWWEGTASHWASEPLKTINTKLSSQTMN